MSETCIPLRTTNQCRNSPLNKTMTTAKRGDENVERMEDEDGVKPNHSTGKIDLHTPKK